MDFSLFGYKSNLETWSQSSVIDPKCLQSLNITLIFLKVDQENLGLMAVPLAKRLDKLTDTHLFDNAADQASLS